LGQGFDYFLETPDLLLKAACSEKETSYIPKSLKIVVLVRKVAALPNLVCGVLMYPILPYYAIELASLLFAGSYSDSYKHRFCIYRCSYHTL